MSVYEAFPARTAAGGGEDAREQLTWNEPASVEAETWQKLFHTVPQGVCKRRLEEAKLQEKQRSAAAAATAAANASAGNRRRAQTASSNFYLCSSGRSVCEDGADIDAKRHWMPDNVCKVCYRCEMLFTFLRRRHHCRVCGLVFCGDCSSNYVNGASLGYSQFVRACDECYEQSQTTSSAPTQQPSLPSPSLHESPPFFDASSSSLESMAADQQQHDSLLLVDEDDLEVHMEHACGQQQRQQPVLLPRKIQAGAFSITPKVSEQTLQALAQRERILVDKMFAADASFASPPWRDTLVSLCQQVCNCLLPSAGDALNILDYVAVQYLPGRTPQDSYLVHGAVLTKNIMHRDMPRYLVKPRIMLLESGLELHPSHSGGAQGGKLVSLEKLMELERHYLDLIVRKICSVEIDLLLCGGTISPVALELLLARNIAVASTVTKRDLKWISRVTGASIVPNTESITRLHDPTGTCEVWRTESIAMPVGDGDGDADGSVAWDTFMFFDNALRERGCTVMLRGERTASELARVHGKFKSLLLRLWTLKLDHAFIACMDGRPGTDLDVWGSYASGRGGEEDSLVALDQTGIQVARVHHFEQNMERNSVPNSHVLTIQFYHASKDRSLRDFLASAFSKQNYTLTYLHGFGSLSFSAVERLARLDVEEALGALLPHRSMEEEVVLTWANCRVCGVQTSVCPLSALVLHMSFGRALQNCFYMQGLRGSKCEHSLLHDYVRFFCSGDLMLSLSFAPRVPVEVQFAASTIDMLDRAWYAAYSHVLHCELKQVGDQVIFHFANTSCADTALRRVEEILSALEAAALRNDLPAPNEINIIYRDLFLQCMEWNVWIQSDSNRANSSTQQQEVSALVLGNPVQSPRAAAAAATLRTSSRTRYAGNGKSNTLLNRRPTLTEIQRARDRIIERGSAQVKPGKKTSLVSQRNSSSGGGGASSSSTSSVPPDSPKTFASTRSAPLTPPSQPMTLTTTPRALNSPAMRGLAASTGTFSQSFRKNLLLNKTLPVRLVEGHLLLPPGRRLGNAVVPVLEDEPTSWIAHALCSNSYSEKLQGMLRANGDGDAFAARHGARPLVLTPASSSEMVLTADEELFHIRSGFSDASEYSPRQCAFSVLSYFAAQFHKLRMAYMRKGGEEESFFEKRFIDSLSRCTSFKPSGGKSTATYLKTQDGRFIIKSISAKELDTFAEIAPQYFAHLSRGDAGAPASLLVPILGLYSLTMQSEVVLGARRSLVKPQQEALGNVQSTRLLVVVMPNIFFNQCPTRIYDLKGNAPNKSRYVKNPGANSVRLDWNFCEDHGGVPLTLHPAAKDAFVRAVEYDALFLASVGVVDYSLLVGVTHSAHSGATEGENAPPTVVAVAAGIIDYLQLYTIQKMLESTVKKLGQADPTVVSPNKYQARFVSSMEKYFASCGRFVFSPQQVVAERRADAKQQQQQREEEDLSLTLIDQSILFQ